MLKLKDMKFVDFSIFVNSSLDFYNLQFPGVFAVYSVKTNRVFLWELKNLF